MKGQSKSKALEITARKIYKLEKLLIQAKANNKVLEKSFDISCNWLEKYNIFLRQFKVLGIFVRSKKEYKDIILEHTGEKS